MNRQQTYAGYSLVEVLVAISVLLLAIVGPLTIASKGLQNASTAKQQTTAFFLAQEGLEAVVKLRDESALAVYSGSATDVWSDMEALVAGGTCTSDNPCGVTIDSDTPFFLCSASTCDLYLKASGPDYYAHDITGEPTIFNRQIIVDVDTERAYVQSIVSWGDDIDERVVLTTYLYNIYEN